MGLRDCFSCCFGNSSEITNEPYETARCAPLSPPHIPIQTAKLHNECNTTQLAGALSHGCVHSMLEMQSFNPPLCSTKIGDHTSPPKTRSLTELSRSGKGGTFSKSFWDDINRWDKNTRKAVVNEISDTSEFDKTALEIESDRKNKSVKNLIESAALSPSKSGSRFCVQKVGNEAEIEESAQIHEPKQLKTIAMQELEISKPELAELIRKEEIELPKIVPPDLIIDSSSIISLCNDDYDNLLSPPLPSVPPPSLSSDHHHYSSSIHLDSCSEADDVIFSSPPPIIDVVCMEMTMKNDSPRQTGCVRLLENGNVSFNSSG